MSYSDSTNSTKLTMRVCRRRTDAIATCLSNCGSWDGSGVESRITPAIRPITACRSRWMSRHSRTKRVRSPSSEYGGPPQFRTCVQRVWQELAYTVCTHTPAQPDRGCSGVAAIVRTASLRCSKIGASRSGQWPLPSLLQRDGTDWRGQSVWS